MALALAERMKDSAVSTVTSTPVSLGVPSSFKHRVSYERPLRDGRCWLADTWYLRMFVSLGMSCSHVTREQLTNGEDTDKQQGMYNVVDAP